ncbi:MAG: GAF domain-containing protein [Armatimonadetes bacterium]|nr:GAF domain-containing protein [Armatimonadota bacterium]
MDRTGRQKWTATVEHLAYLGVGSAVLLAACGALHGLLAPAPGFNAALSALEAATMLALAGTAILAEEFGQQDVPPMFVCGLLWVEPLNRHPVRRLALLTLAVVVPVALAGGVGMFAWNLPPGWTVPLNSVVVLLHGLAWSRFLLRDRRPPGAGPYGALAFLQGASRLQVTCYAIWSVGWWLGHLWFSLSCLLALRHLVGWAHMSQRALHRAGRALHTLSAANQALVRAADPESLLRQVCDTAVAVGGYVACCVGRAELDERRSVVIAAQAGGAVPTGMELTWADEPLGQGALGTAIRTACPAVIHDLRGEPRLAAWAAGLPAQWGSVAAFPLVVDGAVWGAVAFASGDAEQFDDEEMQLLTELAADLSYGLEALDKGAALRRAEAAVRDERQRFHEALDQLPAYLVLLAPDHHVPFANRYFEERYGRSNGKRCYEYLFGRTEPCEVCETYKVLETNAPLDWFWTGPDGREYEIHDYPFTDADGSPLIMEVGLDITDRNRAEAALREAYATLERRVAERTAELQASEAKYRGLFENIQEVVAVYSVERDEHGEITERRLEDGNPAFLRAAGVESLEPIRGLSARAIFGGARADPHLATIREAMASGEARTLEGHIDASGRDYLATVRPLDPDHYLISARDITELKQAAAALRRAHEELERRVEQRTAELGRANALLRQEVAERLEAEAQIRRDEEKLRALQVELVLAEERARRQLGADLHDGLCQTLALVRIRMALGRDEPSSQGADPAVLDLVSEAEEMARSVTLQLGTPMLYDLGLLPAAEWLAQDLERSHGLRVDIADDGLPKPLDEASRVILFRGLRELLLNVVKHAGVLEAAVRLEREGDLVRLTVQDHGAGCDPGRGAGGVSGFGLFSIRERLTPLGGRLEFCSAPGEGTSVTLTVPLPEPPD